MILLRSTCLTSRCNGLPKEWIRNSPAPLHCVRDNLKRSKLSCDRRRFLLPNRALSLSFQASSASGGDNNFGQNEYIIGKHEAINLSIMPKSLESQRFPHRLPAQHRQHNHRLSTRRDQQAQCCSISGEKQHLILQAGPGSNSGRNSRDAPSSAGPCPPTI